MSHLYVFVSLSQLISDKKTAKRLMIGEGIFMLDINCVESH